MWRLWLTLEFRTILDKYWVVSLFVQRSTRQLSRTRLALPVALAAAAALLLVCSAHAEGAGAVGEVVATAEEAATATQATPPPEPVAPVAEKDPEPVQAEPVVTPDIAPAEATATVVHTVAKTVDRVNPAGNVDTVAQQLGSVPRKAVEVVQKADEDLGGHAADLVASDKLEGTLLPAEELPEVGSGASPPVTVPGAMGAPPADSHLAGNELGVAGLLIRHPVELGGLETPWQPMAASAGGSSSSGGPPRLSADGPRLLSVAAIDSAGERFATSMPPIDGNNDPQRWPGSPAGAAAGAGTGSSSFVPIAALLALLALAAPAIFRRLGELADLRAPTPFVCALERPG
jgi:hypothetical protein